MKIFKKLLAAFFLICIFAAQVFSNELHDAAEKGDIEKIKALLEEGNVHIDDTDPIGQSVLCVAILHGAKMETVKYLIDKGANVNAVDSFGRTLKRGANIKMKNLYEKTALDIANEKGYKDIVSLLEKYSK